MTAAPPAAALPNIRACFLPDAGFAFVEADLKQADAQVAAWDADCTGLKAVFRAGTDIYPEVVEHLFVKLPPAPLTALHLNGMSRRDCAKRFVHAVDFGGGAKILASTLVLPQDDIAACVGWWKHTRHPEINEWHRRLEWDLTSSRAPSVRNAFGFRRAYVGGDRSGNLLGQAIAWICQSTTAIVINHAMLAMDCARDIFGAPRCGTCVVCEHPTIRLALQIHDSLLLQVPLPLCPAIFPRILAAMRVTVPYDDPLVIPAELKWSAENWGRMEKWHA